MNCFTEPDGGSPWSSTMGWAIRSFWGMMGWVLFHQFSFLAIFVKKWYICSMKQVITAKLKLHTDSTQFKALRQTQLAYRDALNYVFQYAFNHGKMSNKVALQDGTYAELRLKHGRVSRKTING